jgi:serine/threonine protein kinase
MAPELVKHQKYSEKVDVWSLGCITFQLLSGRTPFDGKNIEKINKYICEKEIVFKDKYWRHISPQAKDFILHCLERDQFQRPSIEDLFDHPWIDELPKRRSSLNENIQLNVQKNLI